MRASTPLLICMLFWLAAPVRAAELAEAPAVAPSEPKPAKTADQANTPDLAYGAFQRGHYLTALAEAKKRLAANPKDGVAMTLIGQLYDQGLGVAQDPKQAAHWYGEAAKQGDMEGTFLYGLAKLTGKGLPQDRAGAAALFTKAAAMNHPGALYNLGVLAVENNGIGADY